MTQQQERRRESELEEGPAERADPCAGLSLCLVHLLDPTRDMCQNRLLDPVEQGRCFATDCSVWVYPRMTRVAVHGGIDDTM